MDFERKQVCVCVLCIEQVCVLQCMVHRQPIRERQGSSGGGGDIAVAGARRGPAHGRPRGSLLASSVGASMLEVLLRL